MNTRGNARPCGVSRPLRQDSKLTLIASGAFEADDLTIDRDGLSIREDRLRVIEAGLRASWPAKPRRSTR